jgi:hypothetical protein
MAYGRARVCARVTRFVLGGDQVRVRHAMKHAAVILVLLAVGCSSGKSGYKPDTDIERHIMARRVDEIKRQAPLLGIPVDRALSTRVKAIYLCQETDRNRDGSIACDPCTGAGCVHAWFRGYRGGTSAEYLFAIPDVKDGCINHEVHHELMVIWYGIGGHPRESTINRLDNGQTVKVRHADVVRWRWPTQVRGANGRSVRPVMVDSWDGLKCGTAEMFMDGGGI